MENKTGKIILAIETGISGGSVSILKDSGQIGYWVGNNSVSKSEDVLSAIEQLFSEFNVRRQDVARIIISDKPGSFTGLRIGMATVLGLKEALNIGFSMVSILDALANLSKRKLEFATAVPTGRNNVSWMDVSKSRHIRHFSGSREEFIAFAQENMNRKFIVHQNLFDIVHFNSENAINVGENMAFQIGKTYLINASDND